MPRPSPGRFGWPGGSGIAGGSGRGDETGPDGGIQDRLPFGRCVQGAGDLLSAGVLGQVAEGPGSEGRQDRVVVGVGGKHHDGGGGIVLQDPAGSLHPIEPGQANPARLTARSPTPLLLLTGP